MKFKQLMFITAITFGSLYAKAQSSPPNNILAVQLQIIITKIGLPADSAAVYLNDFTKVESAPAGETVYKSNADEVSIAFTRGASGAIGLIKIVMPKSMLSTAEKAIALMGMTHMDTPAPPGYTTYATPKYAAFLNPTMPNETLSLVLVQGGN
ncbi:MAG: hypothetical protein ABI203_10375 [Mucilaginibacter sp.]